MEQVSQPSPVSHLSNPPEPLYTSVPAVPLVPPEHLPVQGYQDTGDAWDPRKCVSVALGNWTLCGLTSLTSREAVGATSLLATVAVVGLMGLNSWSTKDSSGWDTRR